MNQLFTYGTLRPNQENAHILGNMVENGKRLCTWVVHILDWGPDKGLPALVLDPQAEKLRVYFLQKVGRQLGNAG
jgi:gamma-glutamylcyclotransferase (GGCT)/AIG2-like uncharacterized protein YtfP